MDRFWFIGELNSCCRWSLKLRIFGCVNAHFSHKDVSQSRQYVYGGLLEKQQNDDDGRSFVIKRFNDDDDIVDCWRENNVCDKSLLWILLAGLSRSLLLLLLFPLGKFWKNLIKSFDVAVVGDVGVVKSKSLLKFDDENGEYVLFKSVNGLCIWLWVRLPDINGSNTLKRRFVDDIDDDVDDADDDGNDEKCDWNIDWVCCWLCSKDCVGDNKGNLLLISEVKRCWSTNSVIQFEQSFDKGLVDDDAITIGISLRHDEHTPPVVPLFILLVSFMISYSSFVFLARFYRGLSSRQATIEIIFTDTSLKPTFIFTFI